jgi:YVTN family beta-propeller protein
MLKLRAAATVKRGLAAFAVASLGLADAVALAGTTTHSATAGVTRGRPAQARAVADRIPAARHGTATAYVVNAVSGTVTPISTATNKPGHAIRTGRIPFAIAIAP